MKLSSEERAHLRASFHNMSISNKVDYIFTYYKLPIILVIITVFMLGYTVYGLVTKKEVLLYTAYINVSVSDSLNKDLSTGFIDFSGKNEQKYEVYTNSALYLSDNASTENHQYAYASQMKIMGAIASKQLDVVFMNQEAYDILSKNGYLYDLNNLIKQDKLLYKYIQPYLTTNTVILEDNQIEYDLHNTDTYTAITEQITNGLNVTQFPLFQQSGGFSGTVYLGVLAEGPRLSISLDYIKYIVTYDHQF